jgi:ribosome-binding factor A
MSGFDNLRNFGLTIKEKNILTNLPLSSLKIFKSLKCSFCGHSPLMLQYPKLNFATDDAIIYGISITELQTIKIIYF